jgi:putative PIN family toxin of toxin-antitoxin system
MTSSTPKVVLDCVVLLQAAVSSRGASFRCRQLVDEGKVQAFLSHATLAELTDVLNRPKLRAKFRSLTPERAAAFLADLTSRARLVEPVPSHFSYARDPDDEPYINLAVEAGADYLVSWDKDLLDLMHENPDGVAFRQRFPNLTVVNPPALLARLGPEEGKGQQGPGTEDLPESQGEGQTEG